MGDASNKNLSREERLAAKLRENLRRRKAQSREFDTHATKQPQSGVSNPDDGS